jgi:hypothetical protein
MVTRLRAWFGDLEETPGAGDAFEIVFASVKEHEVGAGEEIGDGARDQDLVGTCQRGHALADVHRDPGDVVVLEFDLAAMKTRPDLEAEAVDTVADRTRAADSAGGAVEGGQYPVAGGLDEPTAAALDLLLDEGVVAVEEVVPGPVPQAGGGRGRS